MEIAIVHDYIKEYGGAERVLEAMLEIYPDAQVYTLMYLPSFLGPHKDRFKKFQIHTSSLQYLPFRSKLISPARIIAPFLFKSFDFSKFDIVIVSQTGAYTPNTIQKSKVKSQKLICYSHTPPRYLYGYATARDWKKNKFFKVIGEVMNHFLRMVDYKSSQNVDYFIANSENVKQRIQKFYRRNSKVIYPPVDRDPVSVLPPESSRSATASSNSLRAVGNPSSSPPLYFLAGGRIAKPKNIDLIVKTFEELKSPLKIFGRTFAGFNHSSLITHSSNIEFLGEVSDEEKFELMKNAKAYVFASEDEDFGITPVEAMATGTPVIAYRSGGVLESVVEGKTGLFFDKLSVESLSGAVKKFSKMKFNHAIIKKEAQKFSKEKFKGKIKDFLNSKVK